MTQFDRLEEKLRLRTRGEYRGEIQSFMRGTGMDIADIRGYQQGDNPRHINRKATAKHDTVQVNQRQEEKNIAIDLFFDINANRTTGIQETYRNTLQKWLADFAVFCAEYHLQHIYVHFPTTGNLHTCTCSKEVDRLKLFTHTEIVVRNVDKYTWSSHMGDFIDRAQSYKKRRIVCLFSDFLSQEQGIQSGLLLLEKHHHLIRFPIDIPLVLGRNFELGSVTT